MFPCPRCLDRSLAGPGELGARACTDCRGAWLPLEATHRLIEDPFGPLAALPVVTTGHGALRCPDCRGELVRHRIADVEIDACNQHGAWFDHREVERVKKAAVRRRSELRGTLRSTELAVGVATAAAVVASVYGATAAQPGQRPTDNSGITLDVVADGADLAITGAEVVGAGAEVTGAAIEVAGSGVEVASGAFEALGALLEGLFSAL